jgi:hypothetical protein
MASTVTTCSGGKATRCSVPWTRTATSLAQPCASRPGKSLISARCLVGELRTSTDVSSDPSNTRRLCLTKLSALSALPGSNPITGTSPGAGSGSGGGNNGGGNGGGGNNGGSAANRYEQCGGQGWNGPTTCVSPYTCRKQNDYYSQCL